MRYNDIVKHTLIDLLSIMTAEGATSLSLDTIQQTLSANNMSIDNQELTELLDSIPVVNTVKDNVVFFNKNNAPGEQSPEKQEKTVSKLARKQIDKEMG